MKKKEVRKKVAKLMEYGYNDSVYIAGCLGEITTFDNLTPVTLLSFINNLLEQPLGGRKHLLYCLYKAFSGEEPNNFDLISMEDLISPYYREWDCQKVNISIKEMELTTLSEQWITYMLSKDQTLLSVFEPHDIELISRERESVENIIYKKIHKDNPSSENRPF